LSFTESRYTYLWAGIGVFLGMLTLVLGVGAPFVVLGAFASILLLLNIEAAICTVFFALPCFWIMHFGEVMALVLLGSFLVHITVNRQKLHLAAEQWILIAFYLATWISAFAAPDRFRYLRTLSGELIFQFGPFADRYLYLIIFFIILTTYIDTRQRLKMVLRAFIAGALFLAALGLLQGLLGLSSLPGVPVSGNPGDGFEQSTALAKSAHDYSFYIQTAAFLLGAMVLSEKDRAWRKWLVMGLLFLSVGWAFGGSRTALMSVMIVIAGIVLWSVRARELLRKWIAPFIFSLLTIAFFAGAYFFATLQSLRVEFASAPALTGSLGGKLAVTLAALHAWADYPILGAGPGNSLLASYPYWPSGMYKAHVIHCGYVTILTEMGLVGLFLYLAMIALVVNKLITAARGFKEAGEIELHYLATGMLCATVALLIVNGIFPGEQLRELWLTLALASAVGRIYEREKKARVTDPLSRRSTDESGTTSEVSADA
jgi:O-Antigen ligase